MQEITILGRVGKTPDIKTFDNGGQVATFTMADTQKGYTKKDGTKVPDKTEWFNISVGGGLVSVVERFVNKGDQLFVKGKQSTREYTDKSGEKKSFVEIKVDYLELVGGRKSEDSNSSQEDVVENFTEASDDLPF